MDPMNQMARRVRGALFICAGKIPDIPGHGDSTLFEPPQGRRSCPAPVGVGRFVIRATRERGVGVPSSRSLATATREANSVYEEVPTCCRTNEQFGARVWGGSDH